MPSPLPISRNCCLSFIDARRRRGYQTNGTETLRPSTRSTIKASSVSCAPTARNDDSSITKVVIPRFPELLFIFCNNPLDVQEFRSTETVASRQDHRMDPELCTAAFSFHMYMGCFSPVG